MAFQNTPRFFRVGSGLHFYF